MDTYRISHPKSLILLIVLALVLVACGPDEVIRVIITPTPNAEIALQASQEAPSETTTPTPSPTHTATPTATMTSPAEITSEAETPSYIGPIIGPDYVRPTLPPPDDFVIPTVTPTPSGEATSEVAATETPTPEATDTPTPTFTPVPRLDANQIGLQLDANLSFEDFQQAVGLAEATGVQWIKIQVNWDFLQPDGREQMDRIALFERQVELASRPEGMRVLLSFAKAPQWTRSVREEAGPPDNPQALADFITLLLRDTKIGQSVDAIEIWNEPNLQREWVGTLPFNGAGYMQLFGPAYDAVRAYSPTMTIITAGLAPTSNLPNAIDDRDFLQQMYDSGLRNYISDANVVIGAHPYGWANDPEVRCCGDSATEPGWDDNPHFFFLNNIEDTRAIMERNGHANAQMWITEFGWSSWEGIGAPAPEAWHTYLNTRQQADYIIRALEFGQETPYIGPMILWNLNFANSFTVEQGQEIAGFSLIIPTLPVRERIGFWALAQATGALEP